MIDREGIKTLIVNSLIEGSWGVNEGEDNAKFRNNDK